MAMMNVDIATLIQTAGLARMAAPGVINMWSNTMGGTPDRAVGLYQSSGLEPENAMGRQVLGVSNIQVITRDIKDVDAYGLIMAIYDLLHLFVGDMGGYRYTILARHEPHTLGEDENKRRKWSVNFRASRELL